MGLRPRAWRVRLILGLSAALAAGPSCASAQSQDPTYTIRIGGLVRSYVLHVPRGASKRAAPVVMLLHGRLGTGAEMARMSGFDSVADAVGAVVVYPNGYRRSWADGRGATPADRRGVNDVAFLRAVLDDVGRRWPVDAARIYVAGMSNGGFMTQRFACDAGERVAAIGVVAATLSDSLASRCRLQRPMPVLLMNGTEDPLVPYAGGAMSGGRGTVLSAPATAAKWAEWDGCRGEPVMRPLRNPESDGTRATEASYAACGAGAAVVALSIEGGGHTWPGGPQYLPVRVVGRVCRDFDASRALWRFFATHSGGTSPAGNGSAPG
jgi:polyhydroxybutyrate depolymerase